ncbi:MAG: anaerobic ribonucleoside-triphosphate reductase activating protein [Erysipelotrichales bacterium]
MIKEYEEWLENHQEDCLRIINVHNETISDGLGLRLSIYVSGCIHECNGCHNKQSWDYNSGNILTGNLLEEIINKYQSNPLLDGITLSGGDPFYKDEALTFLLYLLKKHLNCNIWAYTGYTYEQISESKALDYIDILVEGRFNKELYHPDLVFKGSSNQRIIDINNTRLNNTLKIIG